MFTTLLGVLDTPRLECGELEPIGTDDRVRVTSLGPEVNGVMVTPRVWEESTVVSRGGGELSLTYESVLGAIEGGIVVNVPIKELEAKMPAGVVGGGRLTAILGVDLAGTPELSEGIGRAEMVALDPLLELLLRLAVLEAVAVLEVVLYMVIIGMRNDDASSISITVYINNTMA